MEFTHLDAKGKAKMVDIGDKAITKRVAKAASSIKMAPSTLEAVMKKGSEKGDVFAAARIAGIMAAKRTSDLIPLCHSLPLEHVVIEFATDKEAGRIDVYATISLEAKTGAEMEALTAASLAALTIYDMCKAKDKNMRIDNVRLIEKKGGQGGHYRRDA